MKGRKRKEKEHYNRQSSKALESIPKDRWNSGSTAVNSALSAPYISCEQTLRQTCVNKALLDYGCGNGIFSIFPAKNGSQVIGVDISEGQIKLAMERAVYEGVSESASFFVGDCEALGFEDDCFDVILSSGTLSCLDLEKAFCEMARLLKPDGCVVIVDTLGHNPLLNLNRKIKLRRGLRTQWTVDHILHMNDLKLAESYFGRVEVKFFDLATLAIAPFCNCDNSYTCSLVRLLNKIRRYVIQNANLTEVCIQGCNYTFSTE